MSYFIKIFLHRTIFIWGEPIFQPQFMMPDSWINLRIFIILFLYFFYKDQGNIKSLIILHFMHWYWIFTTLFHEHDQWSEMESNIQSKYVQTIIFFLKYNAKKFYLNSMTIFQHYPISIFQSSIFYSKIEMSRASPLFFFMIVIVNGYSITYRR